VCVCGQDVALYLLGFYCTVSCLFLFAVKNKALSALHVSKESVPRIVPLTKKMCIHLVVKCLFDTLNVKASLETCSELLAG